MRFADDGALELQLSVAAEGVQASAISWAAPAGAVLLRRRPALLGLRSARHFAARCRISHGLQSNRYKTSTNEIAASFFWSPDGWGAWGTADTRGEINFTNPLERGDAVNLMQETADLQVRALSPARRRRYSRRTRPARAEPQWARDGAGCSNLWSGRTPARRPNPVRALLDGMQSRATTPLGAEWLDEPGMPARAVSISAPRASRIRMR